MDENKSEMSLDEVLSSIKKMVMDEEPPVLELTDMVSRDGSIVKIKKGGMPDNNKNPDMGSFLKLIQENTDSASKKEAAKQEMPERVVCSVCCDLPDSEELNFEKIKEEPSSSQKSENTIMEMIKSVMTPLIQKWLDENLQTIVKNAVESEIKKLFEKK
ncbi:MAG: DUF2497 domain-containing protein [Holosporaceae bacterium]|jgi:cell pole-organizing protein PopZ|nr:DUF2497 domain-containing protein [Holosporaceae bacterium]